MASPSHGIEVAVIGGGIVGLHLVIGLLAKGIKVKVYEQARSFREIGAGMSFVPNAVRAMGLLDPRIVEEYYKIATTSGDPDAPTNFIAIVNGYKAPTDDPNDMNLKTHFKLETPRKGFESVYRADFLDELVKLIPEGCCEFRKRLETIEDRGDDQRLLIKFSDGTTAEADAVIGCDGIKSTVKKLILGASHPASNASYTHMYSYRGLAPMEQVLAAVGPEIALNRSMLGGPGGHLVCYPVSGQKTANLVATVTDAADWPDANVTTEQATREDAAAHFKDWSPAVRALIGCLPDTLGRWAMFDSRDNPAPTYFKGRVAIAGDAAHASSPHHGAGAGMGIEDALAIAGMMPAALQALEDGAAKKADVIRAVFASYNAVRKERSQWLVASSRFVGDMVELQNEEVGDDMERAEKEWNERNHKIWDYDVQQMVNEAVAGFKQQLRQ